MSKSSERAAKQQWEDERFERQAMDIVDSCKDGSGGFKRQAEWLEKDLVDKIEQALIELDEEIVAESGRQFKRGKRRGMLNSSKIARDMYEDDISNHKAGDCECRGDDVSVELKKKAEELK